jgi:hypothetical protein
VLVVATTAACGLTGCSLISCVKAIDCDGTVGDSPAATSASTAPGGPVSGPAPDTGYPLHTAIVSTTFWVGEIFDPNAADGSQMLSTYDSEWFAHYGGCDGVESAGACQTEARSASNGYFPTSMTPLENPFYLDLPFDDINDAAAFAQRDSVVPWAGQEPYASHSGDQDFSYMKNRWVQLTKDGKTCYAQIEDAGPGQYDDAGYVFGTTDARPKNARYGGAGMDVSPAVNSCLGFAELNGDSDTVSWRFVDDTDVPAGPWTRVVTTSQVQ